DGAQTQVPPMHSALKRDGVPLYKLARQGLEIAREPRRIQVFRLAMVSLLGDELIVETLVSKGTYVRVLAEDIGEALGCGAHLVALRRTVTGGYSVDQASTLETLDGLTLDERDRLLLPADSLAMALPELRISAQQAKALQNGQTPRIPGPLAEGADYRVYADSGTFLGVATASSADGAGAILTVMRMMAPQPSPLGEMAQTH
ncbi:MAG: tRNA pseudouridine(55) synthase TruB, partial [Betaproteobacteria bacterium]